MNIAPGVPAPPPAIIVPWTATAPRLETATEDPVWKKAASIDALALSVGPDAVGKKPLPTEIRLLWDADHLYIRFVCRGGDAWSPFGNKWGAPHYQGDVVEVFLDPVGDGRQFHELEISPENGVFSRLFLATAETKSRPDGVLADDFLKRDQWEAPDWLIPGLQTFATRLGKDGWQVLVVLPAKPLLRRLGQEHFTADMRLRANFLRYDYEPTTNNTLRKLTAMNWSPVPWGRPHRAPALMGYVTLASPK